MEPRSTVHCTGFASMSGRESVMQASRCNASRSVFPGMRSSSRSPMYQSRQNVLLHRAAALSLAGALERKLLKGRAIWSIKRPGSARSAVRNRRMSVESTPIEYLKARLDHAQKRAAAIKQLFDDHNRALLCFLRARLGSDAEARDVAQEAYVRLLELDNLSAVGFLRAYLFRVAANIAIDRQRHNAVRETLCGSEFLEALADERSPERIA